MLIISVVIIYSEEIKAHIKGEKYKKPEYLYIPSRITIAKDILLMILLDVMVIFVAYYTGKWIYFNLRPLQKFILNHPLIWKRGVMATGLFPVCVGKICLNFAPKTKNDDDFFAMIATVNMAILLVFSILAFLSGHASSFLPKY